MAEILIVDDELSLGEVIQKFLKLKLKSAKITYIQDSLSVVDYCKNNDVSAVITDINMPQLDGFGLIVKLKELNEELPVYAMSGDYSNKEQALTLGAEKFFEKGASLFNELITELKNY